jgi:hypothetical protein
MAPTAGLYVTFWISEAYTAKLNLSNCKVTIEYEVKKYRLQ